jgi:hypothetical protein
MDAADSPTWQWTTLLKDLEFEGPAQIRDLLAAIPLGRLESMLRYRTFMGQDLQARSVFEALASAMPLAPFLSALEFIDAVQYRSKDIVDWVGNPAMGGQHHWAHGIRAGCGPVAAAAFADTAKYPSAQLSVLLQNMASNGQSTIHRLSAAMSLDGFEKMLRSDALMEREPQTRRKFESTACAASFAPFLDVLKTGHGVQCRSKNIVDRMDNTSMGGQHQRVQWKKAGCRPDAAAAFMDTATILPAHLLVCLLPTCWKNLLRLEGYMIEKVNNRSVWIPLTYRAFYGSNPVSGWGTPTVQSAKTMWMDADVWAVMLKKAKDILGSGGSSLPATGGLRQLFTRCPQGVDATHLYSLVLERDFSTRIQHLNHDQCNTPAVPYDDTVSSRRHRKPLVDRQWGADEPDRVTTHHQKIGPSASAIPNTNAAEISQNFAQETSPPASVYVQNAGLVLAAPFLPRLFSMLGYMEKGRFKNPTTVQRAVHVLAFLAHKRTQSPEFQLTLNKILCGLSQETAICPGIDITPQERQGIDGLILGMINHWKILGKTSPEGLRKSFLQRNGYLTAKDDAWRLRVEPRSFDMLLDQLPWRFAMIKHRWMPKILNVHWRSS